MSNVNEKAANARNAALHGAMLAFAKPKPLVKTSGSYGVPSRETNAATAAAHLAHLRPPPGPTKRPTVSTTPSTHSMRAAGLVVARREQVTIQRSSVELLAPRQPAQRPVLHTRAATVATAQRNRSISPSNVAATLAASRHSSISKIESSPNLSPQHTAPQRSSRSSIADGSRELFVPNEGRTMDVREWLETLQPSHARRRYATENVPSTSELHSRPATSASAHLQRGPSVRSTRSTLSHATAASIDQTVLRGRLTVSVQDYADIPTIDIALTSPKATRRAGHPSYDESVVDGTEYSASIYSADGELESSQIVPDSSDYFSQLHSLPPLNTTSLSLAVQPSNSAAPSSAVPSSARPARPDKRRHSFTPTLRKFNKDLRLSQWAETVVRQPSQESQLSTLTNAMIAGHVASSRGPSPEKVLTDQFDGIRKSSDYGTLLTPLPRSSSDMPMRMRTPSPNKSLRPTLRKTPSSASEDDKKYRRKHFYQRKHPHKHHEGDRKRWRDAITIRERKRYEGVWAANRGIFLSEYNNKADEAIRSSTDNTNTHVSNIVVKDIWSRSRLSDQVLEEVWNLVDRTGEGKLDRDEFVVGMWLIDQRLKGRKLPVKVSSSLWNSVRGIYGLKVRTKK